MWPMNAPHPSTRPDRSLEVVSLPPIKIVQHPAFRGRPAMAGHARRTPFLTMDLHLRVVSLDGPMAQASVMTAPCGAA